MMRYQRAWVSRLMRGSLCVLFLAGLMAASPARSAGPADGSEASQLPAGTLAFGSVAGVDELSAQMKKTGLWSLIQKFPQAQQAIDQAWSQFIVEFEKNSPVPFEKIWELLSGRMAFALVDLDLEALQKEVPPGIVFTLDLTGHAAAWDAVVMQKLMPMMDEQLTKDGGKHLQSDFQGSKLHTFVSPKGQEVFFAVVLKDRLVISTRKALIEGYYQGPTGGSLADGPNFAWTRKKLGSDGFVLLYVDVGNLWKSVRGFAEKTLTSESDREVFKIIDAIGLDGFTGMGYSSTVVQGGVLDRFALGLAQQSKGIVKLLGGIKPAPLGSLALAPRDAVIYSGSTVGNVGALFVEVRKLFESLVPPDKMGQFDQGLAKFKEQTGLDLQKDILENLSGEMGLMLALPDIPVALLDNPIVGAMGKLNEMQLALYLGVEDGAAIDGHLQALLLKSGLSSAVEQYDGTSYRIVTVPNSPVFPGYAILGKTLVIGMNTVTLKNAIDLSKGGDGLQSSERYKKAMSMLSIKDGSAISFMDLPGVLQVTGRLAVAYFQKAKAKGEKLPFDPDTLPKPEELAAFISAIASSSSFGPDGVVAEYYSPFGYATQVLFSTGASAFEQYQKQKQAASTYEPEPESATPESEPAQENEQSDSSSGKPGAEDTAEESTAEEEAPAGEEAAEAEDSTTVAVNQEVSPSEPSSPVSPSEPSSPVSPSEPSSTGSVPASQGPTKARTAPAAPEGWSVLNSTETMASYVSGDYQGQVMWFRSAYSPYLKLQTMVDQIKSSASSMANFKVIQDGALKLGGLQGQELIYEQGDASARQRLRIIYLQDGTNLYTLTMQCGVEKCAGYQKTFDAILAGLK